MQREAVESATSCAINRCGVSGANNNRAHPILLSILGWGRLFFVRPAKHSTAWPPYSNRVGERGRLEGRPLF